MGDAEFAATLPQDLRGRQHGSPSSGSSTASISSRRSIWRSIPSTSTPTAAWPTSCSARAGRIRSAWATSTRRTRCCSALQVDLEVQLGAGHRPAEQGPSAATLVRPARRGGAVHLHLAEEQAPGPESRALPRRDLDRHRVPGGRAHGLGRHARPRPWPSAAASTSATTRRSTTRGTKSSAATTTPGRWPATACSWPCAASSTTARRGISGFAPRITPDDFRAAFTAAEGWGTLVQKRQAGKQTNRVEVSWGQLA